MRPSVRIAALAATAALAAAQTPPRLRAIVVERSDVFSDEEAAGNLFYGFGNLLHIVTDESVIRREVWMQPGDRVTPDEAAELERNLRQFGLFGFVHTQLVPAGDDQQDLVVTTRDRYSLSLNASVASVGGVQRYNLGLSESNLLGTGKSLGVTGTHTGTERQESLNWFDPQFLGTWHTLAAQVGDTDEGHFASVALRRPFHHLDDPFSYGADFADVTQRIDFFRHGDSTAEVPLDSDVLHLFGAEGSGPRDQRQALGLDLRLRRLDYSPAIGPGAGRVRVPGDTRDVEFGPYWTIDDRPQYDKRRRLDAFDYDEDLTLGTHLAVRAAGRYRDEAGVGTALEPVLDLDATGAFAPSSDTYVTMAGNATGRLNDGQLAGWRTGAALHAYVLSLPAQTLAGSVTFDAAEEH